MDKYDSQRRTQINWKGLDNDDDDDVCRPFSPRETTYNFYEDILVRQLGCMRDRQDKGLEFGKVTFWIRFGKKTSLVNLS